jgi:SagB-type dehydrogenase family enzyme
LIRDAHESGRLTVRQRVENRPARGPFKGAPDRFLDLDPGYEDVLFSPYPDCMLLRRSRRDFTGEPVPEEHMSVLLRSLCGPEETAPGGCFRTGFISGNIDGMRPGIYLLDRETEKTGLVRAGAYTKSMADVCLNQAWLARASAHFLFLADLGTADTLCGTRGYRHLMLHAGRLGQRLYVMSTAIGLGCCGIGAFYDREAMDVLGLDEGWRLLYLVAVGIVPHRKKGLKSGEQGERRSS